MNTDIPGYTKGTRAVAPSPVSLADFALMQQSALFGADDVQALRQSHAVVQDQVEIGLRHHRAKKNQTDNAPSTPIVPFRDLFALIFPVTITLKPFLAKQGHSADEVDRMHAAWVKSCLLQVTLWSHAYVKDGDF